MVNRSRTVFGVKPRANNSREQHGMTIPEYMAGQALAGILANDTVINDLKTEHGGFNQGFFNAIADLITGLGDRVLEKTDALFEEQQGG